MIAGRYQPLEAARPGAALRARDLQTAQTVVLRRLVLRAERVEEAAARARRAQGIFHPSLVTLFDVVALAGEGVLLAYEYVPAQPVGQAGGGALHPRRAAVIVAEIADAVAELHAHAVAHGAISRATVLVTLKGKAKLDGVGEAALDAEAPPDAAGDLVALGALLTDLAGRPAGAVVPGAHAIDALAERARSGRFESAAALAAMLRRVAD